MPAKHHVVYVPGLNDQRKNYELIVNRWRSYGVIPHVHRVGWHDEKPFKSKLKRLVEEVRVYLDKGDSVSLVGGSAGGSAVLNALAEEPRINAVVNLCGRLQAGVGVFPSLDQSAKTSNSFKESVMLFEHREPKLTRSFRTKVLCLIPVFDEIVPRSTASLKGATNQTLFSVEHMVSGLLGMTIFSPMIFGFFKKLEDKSGTRNGLLI